jgi:hypothetical protein
MQNTSQAVFNKLGQEWLKTSNWILFAFLFSSHPDWNDFGVYLIISLWLWDHSSTVRTWVVQCKSFNFIFSGKN